MASIIRHHGNAKKKRLSTTKDTAIQETFLFTLENGKRYAHTAACRYQITMASLQIDDKRQPNCACNSINKGNKTVQDENKVTVIVEHDLKEFILCILDRDNVKQCKLNLLLQPGEQVAYRTIGRIPVLLTGIKTT